MNKMCKAVFFLLLGLLLSTSIVWAAEKDAEGCKDHPLFSRMPNVYINRCEESEFDAVEFRDPDQGGKSVKVEGHKYMIKYCTQPEFEGKRSSLQVTRNYANAIKRIGGKTYEENEWDVYLKLIKEGKEIWAEVKTQSYGGDEIFLTIVEKQAMVQEVVADAKTMAQDISATGKVAIYGIYFDSNKAEVKPESDPSLKEIAKLLSQDAKLKLYVVGHTDNVGGLDYNMKLSQARAEAVVKVLTAKYRVDTNRLKPYGVGPLAPVASNKAEDGRAKNRRVELVEQ
jgi:OOP family OmpA-OmpF porin